MGASWAEPEALVRRGPFDLVLGSDLLYESRNADLLASLLPRLVVPGGEILIADPGRPHAPRFLEAAAAAFAWRRIPDAKRPNAAVHSLRPR